MESVINLKESLKQKIINCFKFETEIEKIIIFGSFLTSENPNDIDIAIFQNSEKPYLILAMKYRKLIREISRIIPVDIIPLKSNSEKSSFLSQINSGEIIYER